MGSRTPSPIERLVRSQVAGLVLRMSTVALMVVLVPVGLVIAGVSFVVLGAVLYGIYGLLGEPGPPVSTLVGLGTFGGGLLIVGLVFLRGWRWLRRLTSLGERLAVAIHGQAGIDTGPGDLLVDEQRERERTRAARVAAADARFGPKREAESGTHRPPVDADVRHGKGSSRRTRGHRRLPWDT